MSFHSLERRIRRLEIACAASEKTAPLRLLVHVLATKQLAEGTRKVVDWFRELGGIAWGSERMTRAPNDLGRSCEPGGYLEEVLRGIHDSCPHRHLKGGCRLCRGTPIAGVRSQDPRSKEPGR